MTHVSSKKVLVPSGIGQLAVAKWQSCNGRLAIASWQWPIRNLQLPIANCELEIYSLLPLGSWQVAPHEKHMRLDHQFYLLTPALELDPYPL